MASPLSIDGEEKDGIWVSTSSVLFRQAGSRLREYHVIDVQCGEDVENWFPVCKRLLEEEVEEPIEMIYPSPDHPDLVRFILGIHSNKVGMFFLKKD